LTDTLGQTLAALRPNTYPEKLVYLHIAKVYTRLFTKRPFLKAEQAVRFSAEEACALAWVFTDSQFELPPIGPYDRLDQGLA